MKSIWKYKIEITDEQKLSLPVGAEILTAQIQNGEAFVWAIVDTNISEKETRLIEVFGTGHNMESAVHRRYISTIQMLQGALVFHIFERLNFVV